MTPELREKLLTELAWLVGLLVVVLVVLWRLPKANVGHSPEFKRRRALNWLPLGLTYAFLYFGRYNLSANVGTLESLGFMSKQEFGDIDAIGSLTYGVAFLLNGPLTDRWGGRTTIMLSAGGSAVMNLAMGAAYSQMTKGSLDHAGFLRAMTVLNAVNMYFQSFGAVSIVKVNAPWFHVRERGLLGGVFGILISLGLYFAYDGTRIIAGADGSRMMYAFLIPAIVLLVFCAIDFFVIRDTPAAAGFKDFDTADASSGDSDERPKLIDVVKKMFASRVIWIIVAIEFCSGFLRQAVMKWFIPFAKATHIDKTVVSEHWGLLLCMAGILGGMFAGTISDNVFGSRRGPVASVLYGGMLIGAVVAILLLGSPMIGWAFIFMSLCVIGVHGMLSGTASADFGGKKNAGIATGIIDGFVYLGTAVQAWVYGGIGQGTDRVFEGLLPKKEVSGDPAQWNKWILAMLPVSVIGLILATRVWNARPKAAEAPVGGAGGAASGGAGGHVVVKPPVGASQAQSDEQQVDPALAKTVAAEDSSQLK